MLPPSVKVLFSHKTWREWLSRLVSSLKVYCPLSSGDAAHWFLLRPGDLEEGKNPAWAFRHVRAAEPVKSFFFCPSERVATFPEKLIPPSPEERLLLGVKACDLAALRVHDLMFAKGEFTDPFYVARRRTTILVAADCPVPLPSCFCNLVGGRPYVEDGADLVLSQLDDQFLVEAGSAEGERLLVSGSGLWQPASDALLIRRDEERKSALSVLEQANPVRLPDNLPAVLNGRRTNRGFWAEKSVECVECSGCLTACPTCYCFLLCDSAGEGAATMVRTRVWDACYLAAYQRVGGGANPRAEFLKRFANRFHCKFEHFLNSNGFFACTGCGRCYQTCMGKIDIRKVLVGA